MPTRSPCALPISARTVRPEQVVRSTTRPLSAAYGAGTDRASQILPKDEVRRPPIRSGEGVGETSAYTNVARAIIFGRAVSRGRPLSPLEQQAK